MTTLQDKVDEADETFTVTLAAPATGLPAGVTLQTAGVTVTIADDDERGVTVTPEALNVDEGGSVDYTVVLDTEPTAAVTVTASVQDGTDLTLSPDQPDLHRRQLGHAADGDRHRRRGRRRGLPTTR